MRTLLGMPTLTYVPPHEVRATEPMAVPFTGDEEPPPATDTFSGGPTATGGALQPWTPRPPLRRRVEVPPAEVHARPHDLPDPPDPRLVVARDPSDPRSASFRALRHRLGERGDPRTLLITSAGAREGKTSVAANLALVLAELHRYKVLLIELAPERPQVADLFGIPPEHYTSALEQIQLHKDAPDLPWHVVAVAPHDLHVLPVAPKGGGPGALDAPALHASIDRLRATYDYVVIDGPSVLGGPIVNFAEDAVDGIILVARRERTRGRVLRQAMEQVSPKDLVGVVLVEG